MKHQLVEFFVHYKVGHQILKTPFSVIPQNVVRIERVPEEIPEHQDGMLCRLVDSTGQSVALAQSYDEALGIWQEGLNNSDL